MRRTHGGRRSAHEAGAWHPLLERWARWHRGSSVGATLPALAVHLRLLRGWSWHPTCITTSAVQEMRGRTLRWRQRGAVVPRHRTTLHLWRRPHDHAWASTLKLHLVGSHWRRYCAGSTSVRRGAAVRRWWRRSIAPIEGARGEKGWTEGLRRQRLRLTHAWDGFVDGRCLAIGVNGTIVSCALKRWHDKRVEGAHSTQLPSVRTDR